MGSLQRDGWGAIASPCDNCHCQLELWPADRACLATIADICDETDLIVNTIVADNGSVDGSADIARKYSNTEVILNPGNLGFSRACNQGARAAIGEYLLFLNPDCEVRKGSMERCVRELEGNHAVGVCGVALQDETSRVARTCYRFSSFGDFMVRIFGLHVLSNRLSDGQLSSWDHGNDSNVDHVIGAFYFLRRSLFERLGGFDERF